MSYYVIRLGRTMSGQHCFLSKNKEDNLIYVDRGIGYNTIVSQDDSIAQTIYDHAHGFNSEETAMALLTINLMEYLGRTIRKISADDRLTIEQFEIYEYGDGIELNLVKSLIFLN